MMEKEEKEEEKGYYPRADHNDDRNGDDGDSDRAVVSTIVEVKVVERIFKVVLVVVI